MEDGCKELRTTSQRVDFLQEFGPWKVAMHIWAALIELRDLFIFFKKEEDVDLRRDVGTVRDSWGKIEERVQTKCIICIYGILKN